MKAVRQDADGARHEAEHNLRHRHRQVEHQYLDEDDDNGVVTAIGHDEPASDQKMRAWGTGHQRTCTRPMMYFFGTMPQCRLSELLFRWSPITK